MAHNVTVAQLAIALVLAQGDDIVAVVGPGRPERVAEALTAAGLVLSDADLSAIEEAVPIGVVVGDRYPPPQMATPDSER